MSPSSPAMTRARSAGSRGSAAPRIPKATTAVIRPAAKQRHVEEQVQRDRGADELGQVGGHGDELGLDPQPPGHRPREVVAAQLGQVAPGGDADLRREVLDQHRHQVGGEQHPQQQVAVLRAAGDVRREVAGVDVGDAGDERRPQQGERCRAARRARALQALAGRRTGRRQRDGRAVGPAADGLMRSPRRAWRAPARRRARGRRRRSGRTVGPSNGCLSTTSKSSPGAMPRSAR